jgi:hypothetical protein
LLCFVRLSGVFCAFFVPLQMNFEARAFRWSHCDTTRHCNAGCARVALIMCITLHRSMITWLF